MTTKHTPLVITDRGRFAGAFVGRAAMRDQQQTHRQRIIQELKSVGMTGYGLIKLESQELPNIIHPHEHIKGVVYGRAKTGLAMLVATDSRVIFLDKKPFALTMDEITYDVVSGVSLGQAASFAGLTLHTRAGDYALKFVNKNCAHNFVEYIEAKRLEHGPFSNGDTRMGHYMRQIEY